MSSFDSSKLPEFWKAVEANPNIGPVVNIQSYVDSISLASKKDLKNAIETFGSMDALAVEELHEIIRLVDETFK